ncbi:glycosyltransferase family 4 protein [Winogradskyella sediminis]|uniref:glycosyltransferase family 4 protein n=1 Tax=Winogradskyella sediminis TaxID=1382466 RepID=UPI000E228F26|nr:glycosyltransferase family 4 protein [Winogradskyella sediminis]REG87722.1 glycosyltransferase involved in cell wall biosynthesis [Winogradskyella sediminis]
MIKIFQVLDEYPVFYQPYIPPILDALKTDKNIDSKIVAFKQLKGDKADVVIPKHKWRSKKEFFSNLFRSKSFNYLENLSLKKKVDIVHLQHSFLFPKIINLLRLPQSERPKIVITLRGGESYVKPWVYKKWQEFYSRYADKIDAFIVMSQHQKSYLTKWDVPQDKIHVIPISLRLKTRSIPKHSNLDSLELISVFRLCWEKNIDGHLRIIKKLKDRGFKVRYNIYGDGPERGKLLYLIDAMDLSDCVFYKGELQHKDLMKVMKKADVILQLSLSESLGMSVIEAQSLGVPAVVSNSGGLQEVIKSGKTGYCVSVQKEEEIVEGILNIWEDKKMYYEFSRDAIKYANDCFAPDLEVERLKSLYRNLK